MRICNYIEEGRYAGPQARITLVVEALKSYGIETHVAYSRYDSDKFSSKLAEKKIPNTPLGITRLSKEKKVFVRYILNFFPDIYKLYSFFKKNKFDIVHVNGAHQLKGPIAAKIAGIPVIWHLNDTRPLGIIQKSFSLIARFCATGFIVAGEKVYDLYLQGSPLAKKPCTEIHAPVDVTVFDPEKVDKDRRLATAEGIKIITICNISAIKGLDYYVEMAALLNKKCDRISFFVGGPVYSSQQHFFQKIKAHVNERKITNLTFLGRVDNVAAALQGADIFVFCSLAEASPTAIWEAMAMGKAIVTTDVGSVSQYIDDGISGFIVPVKDPGALSKNVQILIENPALRKKMGGAARAVAESKLNVSAAAQKHVEFYHEIVGVELKK